MIPAEAVARIYIAHCARGPRRCATCAAIGHEAWALIRLSPPPPEAARPVIQVGQDWVPYEVVRELGSEAEARTYAKEHRLPVVKE